MAFKASNAVPVAVYDQVKHQAVQLKKLATSRATELSGGGSASQVMALLDNLRAQRANAENAAGVPGLATYAQEQENDGAYDVVAEFTAMLAALDAAISDIVTAIPKDGGGFLLMYTIDPDGALQPRTFTGAQLTPIIDSLNALAATIE